MSNLLKDRYNRLALEELAEDIQLVYRDFQVEEFLDSIFDETWNDLELKDRVYRISKNWDVIYQPIIRKPSELLIR